MAVFLDLEVLGLDASKPTDATEASSASRRKYIDRYLRPLQALLNSLLTTILASPVNDPARELGRHLLRGEGSDEEGARIEHDPRVVWEDWKDHISASVLAALQATCDTKAVDPRRDLGWRLFSGIGRELPRLWVTDGPHGMAALPTGIRLLETLRRDSMWATPTPPSTARLVSLACSSLAF